LIPDWVPFDNLFPPRFSVFIDNESKNIKWSRALLPGLFLKAEGKLASPSGCGNSEGVLLPLKMENKKLKGLIIIVLLTK